MALRNKPPALQVTTESTTASQQPKSKTAATTANGQATESKSNPKPRNRSRQQRKQSQQDTADCVQGTVTSEQFASLLQLVNVVSTNLGTLTTKVDTLEQQLHAVLLMLNSSAAPSRDLATLAISPKKLSSVIGEVTQLQAQHLTQQHPATESRLLHSNLLESPRDLATLAISPKKLSSVIGEVTPPPTASTVSITSPLQPSTTLETKQDNIPSAAFLDFSSNILHSISAIKQAVAIQSSKLAPFTDKSPAQFTTASFGLLRQHQATKFEQLSHLPLSDFKLMLNFDATGPNAKDNAVIQPFSGYDWSVLSQSGEFYNRTIVLTKKTNGQSFLAELKPLLSFVSELALLDCVLQVSNTSFDLNDIMHMSGYRNRTVLADDEQDEELSGEDDLSGAEEDALGY
jgi:hypothetical protein